MRRTPTIVLLVLLAVLVGACSDGGSDDADAGPAETSDPQAGDPDSENRDGEEAAGLDVCAILTDNDVQGVLGDPAEKVDQTTGDMYGCTWTGTGDALNVLNVSVYVHPDAATAKEMYDATKEGLEGTEITGLGDEASYSESFGLEVLSGRYDISVDNTGPDEKQSDITVAQTVLVQVP